MLAFIQSCNGLQKTGLGLMAGGIILLAFDIYIWWISSVPMRDLALTDISVEIAFILGFLSTGVLLFALGREDAISQEQRRRAAFNHAVIARGGMPVCPVVVYGKKKEEAEQHG